MIRAMNKSLHYFGASLDDYDIYILGLWADNKILVHDHRGPFFPVIHFLAVAILFHFKDLVSLPKVATSLDCCS
jgi:hypothetical protein